MSFTKAFLIRGTEPWEGLGAVGVSEQGGGMGAVSFLCRVPVGGAVSEDPKGTSLGAL